MPVGEIKGASLVAFNIAVHEGLGQSRTALSIWQWLEKDPKRVFDVLVLQRGENFGQMLTEADRSGPDAERGRQRYPCNEGTDAGMGRLVSRIGTCQTIL